MSKIGHSPARGSRPLRRGPARHEPVHTFAEAWSLLRSTSASRDQKGRLVRMFGAALILFAAAGVTVSGHIV